MASPEHIRQSIERSMETVTLKPSRGQRTSINVATIAEGTCCRVHEHHDDLVIDVPRSIGGEGEGPSPSMILRSAISSCVAIGVKQWAARRGVPVGRVEVTLEADVDARGQFGIRDDIAPGFLGLRLTVGVASSADPSVIDDIVRTSLKYSPLMDVLLRPQEVETRIESLQSA